MITPIIHRGLTREDLARLVAEIGRVDQAEAHAAEESLQAGEVDAVLDSPAALEAVHGRGGAPAAVPLTLLWYVPVRAALRARGVTDVELADYVATVPVVFATWRAARAARILARQGPVSSLCARAAEEAEALHAALAEARRDYLGRDAHGAGSRLERFLSRLGPDSGTPPTLN